MKSCSNDEFTVVVYADNHVALTGIAKALEREDFKVLQANTTAVFQNLISNCVFDLCIFDLSPSSKSPLPLVSQIRADSNVGIIIISDKISSIERIISLEMGADACITKPFEPRELIAQARALLRRPRCIHCPNQQQTSQSRQRVRFLKMELDVMSCQLYTENGRVINLTTTELKLLQAFVEAPRRVLSRDFLLTQVHGPNSHKYDRGIDGLVCSLRKKLEPQPKSKPIIKTAHGAGYVFTADTTHHLANYQ